MDDGILIPLASFAAVALITGLINFTKLQDLEARAREALGRAEMDHRERVAELDHELARLRQGV
jgi:hypothetical protein